SDTGSTLYAGASLHSVCVHCRICLYGHLRERRAPSPTLASAGCVMSQYTIEPVGFVRSTLTRLEDSPRQGDEGAPEAWLELTPKVAQGLVGVSVGDELILLTWFHLAQRDVLQVHPRSDPNR